MTLTKDQEREQRKQLRDLLFERDPASLISHPAQHDEYECLVSPLLDLLEKRATDAEVSRFLEDQMRNHFGTLDCTKARESALEVTKWYSAFWAERQELPK